MKSKDLTNFSQNVSIQSPEQKQDVLPDIRKWVKSVSIYVIFKCRVFNSSLGCRNELPLKYATTVHSRSGDTLLSK